MGCLCYVKESKTSDLSSKWILLTVLRQGVFEQISSQAKVLKYRAHSQGYANLSELSSLPTSSLIKIQFQLRTKCRTHQEIKIPPHKPSARALALVQHLGRAHVLLRLTQRTRTGEDVLLLLFQLSLCGFLRRRALWPFRFGLAAIGWNGQQQF